MIPQEPQEENVFIRTNKTKYCLMKCEITSKKRPNESLWNAYVCDLTAEEDYCPPFESDLEYKKQPWKQILLSIRKKTEDIKSIHSRNIKFEMLWKCSNGSTDWSQMAEDNASETENDFPISQEISYEFNHGKQE